MVRERKNGNEMMDTDPQRASNADNDLDQLFSVLKNDSAGEQQFLQRLMDIPLKEKQIIAQPLSWKWAFLKSYFDVQVLFSVRGLASQAAALTAVLGVGVLIGAQTTATNTSEDYNEIDIGAVYFSAVQDSLNIDDER